jgi:Domain of unknown function (DUF1929)/Glyoxal oxidase N-terminus/Kelch motif
VNKIFYSVCFCILHLVFAITAFGQQDPAISGQWSGVTGLPTLTIHTSVLPNGKIMFWGNESSTRFTSTKIWDPATNTVSDLPNNNTNLFCSGHSFLPDGRLLVTGGHFGYINNEFIGEPHTNIYDYRTNTWTKGPDMNAGRWYPSNVTLGNGDVLTLAGQIDSGANQNRLPQIYQNSTGTYRNLTNAQRSFPLYPWVYLTPNGKVFVAGPDTVTGFIGTEGLGSWTAGPSSNGGYRDYGSSVLYNSGKLLIAGGGTPTNSAEVIDLNQTNPQWRFTGSMNFSRRQTHLTVLPDGKVLATGGTSSSGFNNGANSVYTPEMWDPQTEVWSALSNMQERRLYHSTAVLLPDARVLVGGGGSPVATDIADYDHKNMEIFSPPYLFKGSRPTISGASATAYYGGNITIRTPDAANIQKVTLVRLSSVTHSINQNQSFQQLSFHLGYNSRLIATAPTNRNVCQPGYYMLFILNGNGVPSVSKIIRIS